VKRKPVIYVAHPVTGDPRGNCEKVLGWLKWLTAADPSRIYIAPWVAEVLAHIDQANDHDFYERVLADDETVVQRLDGILLCGVGTAHARPNGLMRSVGMTRELAAAVLAGGDVFDLRRYARWEDAAGDLFDWDGLSGSDWMVMQRVISASEEKRHDS
jgi:hypothetical protein